MLQILSKKQFNIAVIIIALTLIPLQIISNFYTFDINVWRQSAPLAKFVFNRIGIELLTNNYFDFAISTILIYIQLFLVYNILDKIKNIDKNSLLATWIYLWIIHLFPTMSNFSPALISSTLILYIVYQFHNHIEDKSSNYLFNISIINGLSFLFWYPSILILVFMFVVLFQYNELTIKKVIIILTSFIIPIIYFICYYIYTDNPIEIIYKLSNFHLTKITSTPVLVYQIIALIIILIMTIVGTFQALAFSSKTAKSSRLFMNSLFTFLIISVLGAFLSINNLIYSGLAISFPLSLFLVYYINIFKRPLFAELAHLSLILLVLINFVFSF